MTGERAINLRLSSSLCTVHSNVYGGDLEEEAPRDDTDNCFQTTENPTAEFLRLRVHLHTVTLFTLLGSPEMWSSLDQRRLIGLSLEPIRNNY